MEKKDIIQEAVRNNFNVSDEYKHLSVEELRVKCDNDRLPISICLLNVTGDLNVGVSIRTALNLGAKRVFIIGHKKYDKRSCVGAHNYIDIVKVKATDKFSLDISPEIFFDTMYQYNMHPIAIEQGGMDIRTFLDNTSLSKFGSGKEMCFIFGNEGMGIPNNILEGIEDIISIPQLGVLRSFNISAAVSIAMWELSRKYV